MDNHSTNYYNTFIAIAEDCPMHAGTKPSARKIPTVAELQYELLQQHPYQYTSDEVLFLIHAKRNDIPNAEFSEARAEFFSRSNACFRASPLPKKYGYGVHFNSEGKMAIYGAENEEYHKLMQDPNLKILKAMRSKKQA